MKTLLFVDHSFHAKTRATVFLQELLAREFHVEVVWDQSWSKGPSPTAAGLNAKKPEAILFFQSLPKLRTLRALRCQNITWVPMRDGLRYGSSRLRHLAGSSIKILNFCREAHAFFSAHGQQSLAAQYWPPPEAAPPRASRERPRVFFWPRRAEIGWETLKALLGNFRPEEIVLRYAADPGHEPPRPSAHDIREYRITILEGWLERAQYLEHLQRCDVFMAPRPLEGIGQAMLEAMRLGLAVIAPDAPTMNEYVKHGETGWLYDPVHPAALDFSGWAGRGPAARRAVEAGHARWLAEADGIAAFVAAPPRKRARWDWRVMQFLRL